ncbi:MAG: glycosyltransferase family 2 protein [Chitinophagaceae bacterium]
MKPSVYVIIPVYNETEVIRDVIQNILGRGYEVVIVDDGSEDGLFGVISGLPVHYIRHELNLGQGAAIQTGIQFAITKDPEILVTFDADGQHEANDIPLMIDYLSVHQLDIVFGSRFLEVSPTKLSAMRKMILKIARVFNFFFSGIMLSDAHNGLRVFNNRTAAVLNIIENKMAHATEILIQIKKNKLKYGEYPVHISYSDYSKRKGQKISYGFKIIQDILLYKFFK